MGWGVPIKNPSFFFLFRKKTRKKAFCFIFAYFCFLLPSLFPRFREKRGTAPLLPKSDAVAQSPTKPQGSSARRVLPGRDCSASPLPRHLLHPKKRRQFVAGSGQAAISLTSPPHQTWGTEKRLNSGQPSPSHVSESIPWKAAGIPAPAVPADSGGSESR